RDALEGREDAGALQTFDGDAARARDGRLLVGASPRGAARQGPLAGVAERWSEERLREETAGSGGDGGPGSQGGVRLDDWEGRCFTRGFEPERAFSLLMKARQDFLMRARGVRTNASGNWSVDVTARPATAAASWHTGGPSGGGDADDGPRGD